VVNVGFLGLTFSSLFGVPLRGKIESAGDYE